VIKKSFLFLDRIAAKTESALWRQGITDWNKFLQAETIQGMSPAIKLQHDQEIRVAKNKLFTEDYQYFIDRFPSVQHWRLYQHLADECAFLDIETNGYYGSITVIGMYDGMNTHMMVKGFNLDRTVLQKVLSKYKMLVTFNGASFDLPCIKKYFQVKIPHVHVDLRHVCARLGYVGGLKSIEKQMGISRGDDVDGVGGAEAVILWNKWQRTREKKYLDKLVAYNEEDIENLKPIADQLIPKLWDKTYSR
jgi:uncharacterized protein YprB with RNaseH-like and TPR domain